MRIRKRFPSSSLPSMTLSDPQLNRSFVVQLEPPIQVQPHGNLHFQECKINSQASDPPNQPPDQNMMVADDKVRWVSSDNSTYEKMKQKDLEGEEVNDERLGAEEKHSNDIRKEFTLNAEVDITFLQSSSSSDQVGRWCEGDKMVPLKKRKRSFQRSTKEETIEAKWKSQTNMKCRKQNGDQLNEKIAKEGFDDGNASAKKKKRGKVIMEGSRCSRVNGRGWRCCQQTLVGYSLCEHHLGKGRLQSMSSVRNRAMANSIIAPNDDEPKGLLSLGENQQKKALRIDNNGDADDDEEKPRVVTKKRMKLGVVKARSISSILGQVNNAVVVAARQKDPAIS